MIERTYVVYENMDGSPPYEVREKGPNSNGGVSVFKVKDHADLTASLLNDFWSARWQERGSGTRLDIWRQMVSIMEERGTVV